jgi:uncharacterized membrane protein YfcA
MISEYSLAWLVGLLVVAVLSGATASVVGFGIGSLLTPVFAAGLGTDVAIAAVSLPHLAAGLLRGWRLRRSVDREVLLRFGLLSAAGGLLGALASAQLTSQTLTRILGLLLLLTASAALIGWSERWKPHGPMIWLLGGLSGLFGGLVGNQGGLRAVVLSTFRLPPATFVATSTLVGVMIDLARTPVYLAGSWTELAPLWSTIGLAAGGVLAGTLIGERILLGLSPRRFRMFVSTAVGALGLWLLFGSA